MSEECKCGFDHYPLPCKTYNEADRTAASSLAAPTGSVTRRERGRRICTKAHHRKLRDVGIWWCSQCKLSTKELWTDSPNEEVTHGENKP